MYRKTLLPIIAAVLLIAAPAQAQQVEVSSGWHKAFSGIALCIPFDGPESDPDDLHPDGSEDILVPVDGQYRLEFRATVGLGWPKPAPLGATPDRELGVMRYDANGIATLIYRRGQARNVRTQVSMGTESALNLVELRAGDRLRLFFRYNTEEEYLWVIVPKFRLEKVFP